ncbi:dTDP-4-dehydrorhamnose reductase family protein [Cysteiniphilum sp. JM-1]|uniref:dTDP-4-dehydrorhamnose reductase family protein n=1 Tax=Cysteiniphilum sp. JM-1 TaxID=2610891 RepID=UPI001CD0A5A2|nr:SDR family oxidoreductase [Cysteiniphilum sp. JM-1]
MIKVLVIGAGGMLGHLLVQYLRETASYELFTASRTPKNESHHFQLDVYERDKLEKLIENIAPNYVINCVGVLVQDAQNHPDNAIYVNAYFPHFLDRLSQALNYKLVHISTDCVFDGKKGGYTEVDIPNETNFYGRSKALGEVVNDRNLTIRTSIIGPETKAQGVGLFHWFMQQKGDIQGFSKAIWSGVTTLELAKFIHFLMLNQLPLNGLIHLGNNQRISKKDLLCICQKVFNKRDVNIQDNAVFESDKSFISTRSTVDYIVPDYEVMIVEMHHWINMHRAHYPMYQQQN